MKTELFREINGRFLLIEHGDPHSYCINSIRTVFPKQNNKVSKKILRKKPFRVQDRTSIYLRHRLLFECPVNLKLFGHVLYDTDDHAYVQSQPIHEISICSGNIEHVGFARLLPENAFKHCIRQRYTLKRARWPPIFIAILDSTWLVEYLCQVSLQIYGGFFSRGITLSAVIQLHNKVCLFSEKKQTHDPIQTPYHGTSHNHMMM